jgi:DNA-binding Xre family transcriptional regulator
MSLPTEPLALFIERTYPDAHTKRKVLARYHEAVAEMLSETSGVSKRTIQRILARDLKTCYLSTADEICNALGVHPYEVYGKDYGRKWCPKCEMYHPLYRFGFIGHNGGECLNAYCKKCCAIGRRVPA